MPDPLPRRNATRSLRITLSAGAACLLLAGPALAEAGDGAAGARLRQEQADSVQQLERQQEAAAPRLRGDLPLRERLEREDLLHRQRLRQQQLHDSQRSRERATGRMRQWTPGAPDRSGGRAGQFRQEREAELLQFRLQQPLRQPGRQ